MPVVEISLKLSSQFSWLMSDCSEGRILKALLQKKIQIWMQDIGIPAAPKILFCPENVLVLPLFCPDTGV